MSIRGTKRVGSSRRGRFGVAIAVALLSLLVTHGVGEGEKIRNVLLITLDTTRADHLGCYGAAGAVTPNLDRLAREGTRFAHCMTSTPLTTPSHSTIMTGTYPFVHGVHGNGTQMLGAKSVTLAEILKGAGYATHAIVASFALDRRFGVSQGFDTYDQVVSAGGASPASAERSAGEVVDHGIEALGALAGGPFFLWTHFYDPHYPYESRVNPGASPAEAYADEITYMDGEIGRLLEALRTNGVDRNTLVVVAGDHGEAFGGHGEFEHGYFVYETTMDIPLIIWCPGAIGADKVVDAQVRTVDLLPTILDYLGRPSSEDAQGVSLRPLLKGETDDLHLAAYGESGVANEQLGLSRLYTLQVEGWKYIYSSEPELYDVRADPREMDNRIADEPERAEKMRRELAALVGERGTETSDEDRSVDLTAEERQRLEALGYAIPSGGRSNDEEKAPLDVLGDNPANHAAMIQVYQDARRDLSLGNLEEAAAGFRRVVLALPDAPLPRDELGGVLRRLKRENEIYDVAGEALAAHPEATGMRAWLTHQLFRAGRQDEAMRYLREGVLRDPGDGAAEAELGAALQALGKESEAKEHLEKALGLGERSTMVLRGLAVIYEGEGKKDEAVRLLEEALELKPDSRILQSDLERIRKQ